jgi:hypothetical protein
VTITVRGSAPCSSTSSCGSPRKQASCELYGLLKRADEKYVTERAYDNPKFVEDLVRDVAQRLAADPAVRRLRRRGRELRVDPQPLGLRADRRVAVELHRPRCGDRATARPTAGAFC